MINNLGGISELELGGLVGTSMDILAARKIKVRRVLAGTYMVRLSIPPLLWSGRL
jgi:dihydroxyacetone kinase